MAATSKILFSLVLCPLAYALEAWLIARWVGPAAALVFAVLIVPLSYFTLLFFEWREELGTKPPPLSSWLNGRPSPRVTSELIRLRRHIVKEVDSLASLPESQ
jgi:hypothetical protein